MPDRRNSALATAGVKRSVDSDTGHENERISAEQKRQPVAFVWGDPRFLQKILKAATRPPRVRLQSFAAAAQANRNRVAVELVDADTAGAASLHDEGAAEFAYSQRCLSAPDARKVRSRG